MLNTDNNYTYLIKLKKWKNSKAKLPILLGVDENGEIIVEDLAECKNLKIVGANDDIKNGFINSIIMGLKEKISLNDIDFIFINPSIEFVRSHNDFLGNTDWRLTIEDSIDCLKRIVNSVIKNIQIFSQAEVKNIYEYNRLPQAHMRQEVIVIFDSTPFLKSKYKELYMFLLETIRNYGKISGYHIISVESTLKNDNIDSILLPSHNIKNLPNKEIYKFAKYTDQVVFYHDWKYHLFKCVQLSIADAIIQRDNIKRKNCKKKEKIRFHILRGLLSGACRVCFEENTISPKVLEEQFFLSSEEALFLIKTLEKLEVFIKNSGQYTFGPQILEILKEQPDFFQYHYTLGGIIYYMSDDEINKIVKGELDKYDCEQINAARNTGKKHLED